MKIHHPLGVPSFAKGYGGHAKLEARSHRECLIPCECSGIFVRGVPRAKNSATVSWSHTTRKRRKHIPPPSQCIPPRSRGVYFLHMYSCGKINATFDFASRWFYLCASSEAGGEVFCLNYPVYPVSPAAMPHQRL